MIQHVIVKCFTFELRVIMWLLIAYKLWCHTATQPLFVDLSVSDVPTSLVACANKTIFNEGEEENEF